MTSSLTALHQITRSNDCVISKIHMKDERIDVRLSYVSRAAIFLKNNATFTGGLRADPWQINSENAGVL